MPTPPADPPEAPPPPPDAAPWAEMIQQLGAEIAGPLSTALERIHNLINTGQIDRQSLRTLRESVSQAREAGMVGQQLARLASGRLRLQQERLPLAQLLRGVIAHRSRETQARGIQVRQQLKALDVLADGALMFSLLNALMDWALASTHSSIDLRLDLTPWPVKARLVCRFANRALDLADDPRNADAPPPLALNSLAWRLVEQTALTLGAQPLREDEHGITVLILDFPHPVGDEPGLADARADGGQSAATVAAPTRPFAHSGNSKPLAGSHLLIVSADRALQLQVLDAVAQMGLIVDAVGNAEEAEQFCEEGLPHGILFDSAQQGPAFEQLRAAILAEVPGFSFIELVEQPLPPQPSGAASPAPIARIARGDLAALLPALLVQELGKGL